METIKERVTELVEAQPDDATFDDILHELALARMIDRGLADGRSGRTITSMELTQRVKQWVK
jgi:predicted transcriptional regulator